MDTPPISSKLEQKLAGAESLLPRGAVAPELASKPTEKPSGTSHQKRSKQTAIFIQDECLKHRFIRSRDTSGIVERPERLRAVKIGLAAAISRVEEVGSNAGAEKIEGGSRIPEGSPSGDLEADDLSEALERMKIASTFNTSGVQLRTSSVSIRKSSATVDLLNHPAVKFIHGDVDGDVYLENLIIWARDSQENISKKGSEIPEGIPPLDLYLCPNSIDAIQGAIGAVCEAVDAVIDATRPSSEEGPRDSCERAFVAIRPPGHHCGEDTPSGFCFVNNVAIGAAHAHLNHGIKRVVILDIDLHHGNGTQSIVWQINEETYRQTLESEFSPGEEPPSKPGPQIYYGSLHDILSFPCEDGKPQLVQAASTSIHGSHGQYIENIHLQRYDSETHFWEVLYPRYYLALLYRARDFLDKTGGPGDDVMIFISCGFDACEHEYPSMSRHNRKVPTSFYHRFTRDTCALADKYARGRLVSVLEGGYSDRALTSGAMAHLCGMLDVPEASTDQWVNEEWWDVNNLTKLERATKSRKGSSRPSLGSSSEDWLSRTLDLLPVLDSKPLATTATRNCWVPPTARTLRERKKPSGSTSDSTTASGAGTPDLSSGTRKAGPGGTKKAAKSMTSSASSEIMSPPSSDNLAPRPPLSTQEDGNSHTPTGAGKKLPRVILHVRPPPETTS
ncbi:hypothetical protein HYDPIDRAFT_32485 [Hydnomerulius pinastri MD-312]|uniref:Histone deacetylase domain-containing protein n=1 Tax=Hydnomerulius pinastri MD-312 TaxID=994086 RepID=A0A0C9VR49_9AGAM|nr:hypothetical protein HYDPIDRAFT_32485 [Hydnomerulius pinastri MD-312]